MKLQKKSHFDNQFLENLQDLIFTGHFSKARRKYIRLCNRLITAVPKSVNHETHRPVREYLKDWGIQDRSHYPKVHEPKFKFALLKSHQYNFYGYRRLTHKYRTAYRDLDQSEYVGEFRVLKVGKMHITDEEYGSYSQVMRVKGNVDITDMQDLHNIMSNSLSSSCACEHDCCGHAITHVNDVKRVGKREYLVFLHTYYNM